MPVFVCNAVLADGLWDPLLIYIEFVTHVEWSCIMNECVIRYEVTFKDPLDYLYSL